jgi:hypothetical protein
MWKHIEFTALLCAVAACTPEETSIRVNVLASGGDCVVDGRQMRCDSVGVHLRDSLKMPVDRPITVFVEGTEGSEERGLRTGVILRDAGFSRIVRVGFLTEPGEPDRE